MGNNLQRTFTSDEYGEIRTIQIDSVVWFVAVDITRILGYTNSRKAIADHVDDEDKNTVTIRDGIGNPNKTVINESGLYSLILSSKLSSAKGFKRWVTSEVLPTIRTSGYYSLVGTDTEEDSDEPQRATSSHEYLQIAKIIASCRADRLPLVLNILSKGGWDIAKPQELARNGHVDTADISIRLKAALDKYGLKPKDIAERVGLHRTTIEFYIIGKRFPRPKTYVRILNVIDSLEYEFSGDDDGND